MITLECDDLPIPPYILVLPRRDFAVNFRSYPACLLALYTSSPIPRSIELSHNDSNIVFTLISREQCEQRRIKLPSFLFYLLLSSSIFSLEFKIPGLTLNLTAMAALSVATFPLLDLLLVVCEFIPVPFEVSSNIVDT
jgi:hypothetical protein